jgi:hypothetical protein
VGPPIWRSKLGAAKWSAVANYRTAGLAEMVQAIGERRAPRCSLDATLHGVDVMTSILKSAESGNAIELTT